MPTCCAAVRLELRKPHNLNPNLRAFELTFSTPSGNAHISFGFPAFSLQNYEPIGSGTGGPGGGHGPPTFSLQGPCCFSPPPNWSRK